MTKLATPKRIRVVRCKNGFLKYRALRLDVGNFSWPSEGVTRKTRLLDVVYNASNNELERTKTLVKNSIVQIDGTPFKQWFENNYGMIIGRKKGGPIRKEDEGKESGATPAAAAAAAASASGAAASVAAEGDKKKKEKKTKEKAHKTVTLDPKLDEQFSAGRLYACVSSRPGQCGRCDGYILEGKELEFYVRKMRHR